MHTQASRCSNLKASQLENLLFNPESECKGKLNGKNEVSNAKRSRLHTPK